MNRADQAPEPSIEELLASIRLIISDADKQVSFPREPHGMGVLAGASPAGTASSGAAADEVFDLTDELVFPEEQIRAQAGALQGGMRGQAGPEVHPGQPPHFGQRRGALPGGDQGPRFDTRQGGPAAAAQAVWSRRELPDGGEQASAAPRLRQEPPTPRPQARNWAGDIQMPVSELGPVPLFPSPPGHARAGAPAADAPAELLAEAHPVEAQGEGEGAVAVLAQRLARSAMGVLEASELESAKQVDFEHLDAHSKADVAEKFADAIEVVAQAVEEDAELLEVVDAHAAMEQAQKLEQTPGNGNASAPAVAKEEPKQTKSAPASKAEAPAKTEVKPQAAVKPEPVQQAPAKPEKVPEQAPAASGKQERPASPAPAKPAAAPAPVAVQPLAQAQFMGATPMPSSAPAGGPLETAVRDMLRPLLVQWLNENMPRILENAIREEIAVRGLLPKSDG
jgi:cell pole-organizing protein PopZ